MSIISDFFLPLYGLKNIIGKEDQIREIVIRVEGGEIKEDIIKNNKIFYREEWFRKFFNLSYRLIIGLSIIWPFIYAIYKSISSKELRYITSETFIIMYFSQLVFGSLYYRHKHYMNFIMYTGINNNNIKGALILSFLISTIVSLISVILLVNDVNLNFYSELYNNSKLYGKILLCFSH